MLKHSISKTKLEDQAKCVHVQYMLVKITITHCCVITSHPKVEPMTFHSIIVKEEKTERAGQMDRAERMTC